MKLAELAPQVGQNENGRVGSPGRQKRRWQSWLPRLAIMKLAPIKGGKMKFAELAPQVGNNEVGPY